MKLCKLFYLFFLLQIQGLCQSNYTIKGIVVDSDSKEPIPYVFIRLIDTEKYFITDSLGKFKFNSLNTKFDFNFQHLNYKKNALTIDTLKNTTTELTLVFRLQKKENILGEIVISSKTEITNVASNIIDYNFIDNKIVVLNYKVPPHQSEITILNEQLDTLNISKLYFEPESLFKDCFGNIHVLSADSSYQLFYQNAVLGIYAPYPIIEFEKKLGNCYTSTNDFIYFIEKRGSIMITNTIFRPFPSKNDALSYFYITKKTKKKDALFDAFDKRHGAERKEDNEAEKRAIAMNTVYISPTIFRETIVLDEIYAPLFVVNDSLIVFDFINNEINIFKNNTTISKTKIDFHITKTWKRLMLFDDIRHKTYSKYTEDDKFIIKEIDYINGKVGKSFNLPNLCFKLKIMNGKTYYLMKNSNNSNFNVTLNRVFLK
jgi:hypothetical protein